VAFFYHLTDALRRLDSSVVFLPQTGPSSSTALHEAGRLVIAGTTGIQSLSLPGLFQPGLAACASGGLLPEVLLVCTNPDQLLPALDPCVAVLEREGTVGGLRPEAIPLPLVVLCANGIYFQRVRQVFIERLEEATLLGRLPDLWPHLMPAIVGRLMRGVTIQTGVRDGNGPDAVYRPGPPGLTRIAGGDAVLRRRAVEILARLGGVFELVEEHSPTRVEFDKALVNLVANLLGQLAAIDAEGRFTLLTVGEVLERVGEAQVRVLVERVVQVGRAVRAYGSSDDLEAVTQCALGNLRRHASHIPSSLQWLGLRQQRGEQVPGVSPTEAWLLDPLVHYARSAGLEEAVAYFTGLRESLEERLRQMSARAGIR
jgi:hypothetical protein